MKKLCSIVKYCQSFVKHFNYCCFLAKIIIGGGLMKVMPKYGKMEPVSLGGTGDMYLIRGEDNDYIYKPAVKKYTSIKEPFRGVIQECAYDIQRIVDPSSAVWCKYLSSPEVCGAIQEKVPVLKNSPDYHIMQLQDDVSSLSQEEINQFMREFVTDYLLCNFDGHGRNFVTGKDGIIRGVDKEQSFRYLNDPEAEKPSIDYSPNTDRYHETEPIYNTLFRAYSEGRIDIDFSVIDKCMMRVELVDEETYRSIFSPYCDACSQSFGSDSVEMLDKIVARKTNMRSNITSFFQELTAVREENLQTGKGSK